MIKVTRRDVMSSQTVEPGWFPVEVTKLEVTAAKKDQSTNYVYSLKHLTPDYVDVNINKLYINEKGMFSTGLNFFKACGLPEDIIQKIKNKELDDFEFDENMPLGKKIMAKIVLSEYEGRVSNQAQDFMPMG